MQDIINSQAIRISVIFKDKKNKYEMYATCKPDEGRRAFIWIAEQFLRQCNIPGNPGIVYYITVTWDGKDAHNTGGFKKDNIVNAMKELYDEWSERSDIRDGSRIIVPEMN